MFEENWDGFGSEDEKTSPKTEEERVAAPAAKKRRRDDDTSVEGKNEGKKEEEEQQEKEEEEEWTVNGLTREQEHAALVRVAAALAASASGATVAYTGDAERRFVAAVLRCCRSVAAEDEPTRSRIAVAARSDADTADRGAPLAVRVQGVLDAAARTHERAHDTFRRVTALLAATPVRALAAAAPALARVRCVLCEDGAWRPLAACLYCDDDACAALWERVQASTSTTTSESGAALFGRSAWALGGLQRHRCAALWRHAGARFVSDLFERRVGDRRDAADDYDLMAFLRLHSDRIQQHVRATRRATYDLLAATGVAARLCNLRIVRCTSFRVHEVFRGTNNSTSTSVGERAFEVEGAVAALCRERDGDVLCYASTLPAPLVPAAVLLEATKALSATARHASQRVWRVLVALAASRDRADACRARARGGTCACTTACSSGPARRTSRPTPRSTRTRPSSRASGARARRPRTRSCAASTLPSRERASSGPARRPRAGSRTTSLSPSPTAPLTTTRSRPLLFVLLPSSLSFTLTLLLCASAHHSWTLGFSVVCGKKCSRRRWCRSPSPHASGTLRASTGRRTTSCA